MMRHNSPTSVRYLRARLKPFSRPVFWLSLGVFAVLGITIYQYWQHPDWLKISSEATNDLSAIKEQTQFSSEDLAVGADIDNLDLLIKELEQDPTLPLSVTINSSKKEQNKNPDTVYSRFQTQQTSKPNQPVFPPLPTSNQVNLFQSSTQNSAFPLSADNNSNQQSQPQNLISNPVGKLYLSNRQQLFNRETLPENNLQTSVEQIPAYVNSAPTATNVPANPPNAPVVNQSPFVNNFQFSNPYVNPYVPGGVTVTNQPIPTGVANQPTSNLSGLPPTYPNNYQSPQLGAYQLNPTNYQLQPRQYNRLTPNPSAPGDNFNQAPVPTNTLQLDSRLQTSSLNQPFEVEN